MKTITYDETKFQLLPVSLDGNMITAAANAELLANRNHGEPASISDLWDALRAAAPQPDPSRTLAGWDMSPADMKSVGQDLIDAAEAMSGGEADCDLILSVVPERGFVDDDGVSNTHPILLVLCVDAEQEGGYPIDPWDTAPQPECVEQPSDAQGEPDYWAAVDADGCIANSWAADDGNNGEAARQECNDWINNELQGGGALHHLISLYRRPAPAQQPVSGADELQRLADQVVLANATSNPDLHHDAVAKLIAGVRNLRQPQPAVPEEFEDWFVREYGDGNFGRLESGEYADLAVRNYWGVWCAASAAPAQQPSDDEKRLVRELDVLLNGEDGAAQQASLCDIVAQVQQQGLRVGAQGEPVGYAPPNWTLGMPVTIMATRRPGYPVPVYLHPQDHGHGVVYQILAIDGCWEDVSKERFERESLVNHKRILYTAPAQQPAVPKALDLWTNNGDQRPDFDYRRGWNACREAMLAAKDTQSDQPPT